AQSCIFKVGSPGDACFIIDEGLVRVDLDQTDFRTQADIDSDTTLGYIEAGGILGELSLLDRLPRSASAFAQTDVTARRISADDVDKLVRTHPTVGAALYAALGRDAATKLRRTNERLADVLSEDAPDPDIDDMVARAVAAQREIETWPEDRINSLLSTLANSIANHAEELANASVAETGLGDVQSKIVKDVACSVGVYGQLARKPGWGPTAVDEERRITEIASPVGVVFALGPVTNPVSTFVFKAIICIKSRNALIYSPNRRAQKVAAHVEDLIKEALRAHGAPLDLVQCVRSRTSRKQTRDFMRHENVSFILATGGPSMVKAAYSSGTPAIGVGPANTPVLICSDADIPDVVRNIVMSKTFDNGLLCGAEHNLVVMEDVRQAFVEECERKGAAVLSPDESEQFTAQLVRKDGSFKGTMVGQPADKLACQVGITRDYPIKLLIVPSTGITSDNAYAREKMAPVLSLFTVATVEEGLQACYNLLLIDGPGHTAVIFSQDSELIDRFGAMMPAGRILVNCPAVHGMLGITTGLAISTTLGCGTFGGTSTTDNVTYTHLQNTKRLAHFLPEAAAIWQKLGFL
ncbi:MAG TPA: aldehyde dehydrogenase family protein, partial [Chloroflexota bacterium]